MKKIKNNMNILVVENNEYELPVTIYDSYKEMAKVLGITYDYAVQKVSRKKDKKYKYIKIILDNK